MLSRGRTVPLLGTVVKLRGRIFTDTARFVYPCGSQIKMMPTLAYPLWRKPPLLGRTRMRAGSLYQSGEFPNALLATALLQIRPKSLLLKQLISLLVK